MALEFSTAGVIVKWAVEQIAGQRPEAGYSQIPGIKSTPDYNPEPSTMRVTDLSDTEWHRYIPGLKDVGGASAFSANLTKPFKQAWDALVAASDAAFADGKSTWFEIRFPDFDSFYFAGRPSPLGLSGLEVDSVVEIDAYVVPNELVGFAAPSTAMTVSPATSNAVVGTNVTATISGNVGTVSATSTNSSVATATVSGTSVTIIPAGEGVAVITLTDGTSGDKATIIVTVSAE